VSESRLRPIISGGRCIGHLYASARGIRAFDAQDQEIGTYSTAEQAIGAISERAGLSEKREANGAA
jgi:hypothetical protein